MGPDMVKGVLGLSTALSGLFSYTCALPSGFTFSLLLALLREKVEMESAGRETFGGAFEAGSGEYVSASVADGVLLCEDEDVLVLVRSEALRAMVSVTELAIEIRLACRRCLGGLAGACSYWLGMRGGVGVGMGVSSAGGVVEDEAFWCPFGVFPPKKEGRRVKKPFEELGAWSPIVLKPLAFPRRWTLRCGMQG